MKIVFPEHDNPIIKEAIERVGDLIEPVYADSIEAAAQKVADGEADSLVAGIDYTSRDVILACRDIIGAVGSTFSSCFVFEFPDSRKLIVADCATCKNPTSEQLFDIVTQTYETASKVLTDKPLVAMLSFSTNRSGGKDPSIDRAEEVIARMRAERPEIQIDGEMQLDAAVNERIGAKKFPGSAVAGRANVLIVPDLNSGNILYKAIEQFGGAHAYGPILQGFNAPVSDLSRGSTVEDVVGVIKVTVKRLQ